MDPAPTFISLFSGCGGMDLGFLQAGFRSVWANDLDTESRRIHELNLPGRVDPRDIREVGPEDVPDADVLIGAEDSPASPSPARAAGGGSGTRAGSSGRRR
jgi:site-specific DNA-cytosine methylase